MRDRAKIKKVIGQTGLFLVLCVFGFIIAYQLKAVASQENNAYQNGADLDITEEITKLSEEKKQLQAKVDSLQGKLNKLETSAIEEDEQGKYLFKELETYRVLAGETEVKGEGISISIIPKSLNIGGNTMIPITHIDILRIINELNFNGAEAIEINDIRYTNYKGIRSSDGGNTIFIGDDRISPRGDIIINAIGNKEKLHRFLTFPGLYDTIRSSYDVTVSEENNLELSKSTSLTEFKYSKIIKKD